MRAVKSVKSLLIFLRKLIYALACVSGTLAALNAHAEEPPAGNPSVIKTSQAVCSQSLLTQEKFLDMVHAIAVHGDLTDIPFLEKTLQAKFESHHFGDGITYEVDSYRGTPIKIFLKKYDTSKLNQRHNARISFANLDRSSVNFFNCDSIVKEAIDKKFTEYLIRKESDALDPKTILGPTITDKKTLLAPDVINEYGNRYIASAETYGGTNLNRITGKYASFTKIGYELKPNNKAIFKITIEQIASK